MMAVPTGAELLPHAVGECQIGLGNPAFADPQLLQVATRCDCEPATCEGAGVGAGPVGEPMARARNLLNARFVATVTEEGKHSDGGGLYLLVRKRGDQTERLWMFRYKRGGRGGAVERAISLGAAREVSLAVARDLRQVCHEALARGDSPKAAIDRQRQIGPTFGEVADALVEDLCKGFENEKTRADWRRTLGDGYCASLRKKPVAEAGTEDVLAVLKPVWLVKQETASRVRERIERVFDAAKVQGLRSGENPARWKGHLKFLLPAQTAKRGHHRALPYQRMPVFMPALRALDSVSALALEWTILTCARTGESIGALRTEIDRATKVWTVPAERMKERREHRVPLSDRCLEIFDEMAKFGEMWLFPARDPREHLSEGAMTMCLRRLKADATVHGFRSTFRDWAGDCTGFPREIAEAALSHAVGDEAERAYRRSDALERRRKLMDAWARYCLGGAVANVVQIKGHRS
jgi:integrase